jgi:glutamine---fructose-6-phosphate transaminase (isomerizing)
MSQMLAEIRQQPAALDKTLRSELRNFERLRKRVAAHPPRLIVLAARGTSDNAAQFARYLLEIATGIPVSLAAPSIFTLYNARLNWEDVLTVAISQSGESTDTNYVLEQARKAGSLTVGITNEPESSLAKMAEFVFCVRSGREKSVAATKTYTGQLLACYLLAWALGGAIDLDELRRLPECVQHALNLAPQIDAISERYTFMTRVMVVGRGLNYSNAFEFALKMMETCYVVAERFSSADLMHGPIAMVESAFPVFLFTPPGVTWPGLHDMLVKLQQLKADATVITDLSNRDAIGASSRSICLPMKLARKGPLPVDVYTPIPYIVPAQLFAAHLAAQKGINPDHPRTLSKVTLTL